MSTISKQVIAFIAVLWLVVLAIMVALTSQRPQETLTGGGFEKAVAGFDEGGVNVGMLIAADSYGTQFAGSMVICPGTTAQQVEELIGLDPSAMDLGNDPVPEGTNYLLLFNLDGSAEADAIDMNRLNLCTTQTVPMSIEGPYYVAKTEEGGWALLA